ncbi:hypothetical protein ABK046_17190 [Streptomyces caeruleatus]
MAVCHIAALCLEDVVCCPGPGQRVIVRQMTGRSEDRGADGRSTQDLRPCRVSHQHCDPFRRWQRRAVTVRGRSLVG